MTTKFLPLLIAILFSGNILSAQTKIRAFHVGFIYPVSSNGLEAREYINHCSFHAIAGLSGGEEGVAISGLANVIRNDACGGQFAGFSNHIGGNANGGQFAGFMNYVRGRADGIQAAGFANLTGSATGIQLAGFTNVSAGNTDVQCSGFVSVAQTAHTQLSGFANVAKDIDGIQCAGFVNVARDVAGSQIAGFINTAKTVKGVQLSGFINIADSCDYPIGLINIVKNGERAIGISMDETQTGLVSFRSGGKRLYGILGVGANTKEKDPLYALEAGLGIHIPVVKRFRINMEITALALTDFEVGNYLRSSYRLLPALSIGKLEVFAGPTINCVNLSYAKGFNLVNGYTYEHRDRQYFTGIYFGGIAGVQLRL